MTNYLSLDKGMLASKNIYNSLCLKNFTHFLQFVFMSQKHHLQVSISSNNVWIAFSSHTLTFCMHVNPNIKLMLMAIFKLSMYFLTYWYWSSHQHKAFYATLPGTCIYKLTQTPKEELKLYSMLLVVFLQTTCKLHESFTFHEIF